MTDRALLTRIRWTPGFFIAALALPFGWLLTTYSFGVIGAAPA